MIVYRLAEATPTKMYTAGATLGQEHLRPLRDRLTNAGQQRTEVIVDFGGIQATTASYVKATVLWLFQSGQLAAGVPVEIVDSDPFRPLPLDVFPFVSGMYPEVAHEVNEVFAGRKLPCLEAVRHDDHSVLAARLLGAPEETARRTLEFLLKERAATATMLHDLYPMERIKVTGWNNRLAELYALRLAYRSKCGKQWVYEPIAKEVLLG